MSFAAPSKKDRRRKAAATLPGQRNLNNEPMKHVALPLKIPNPCHTLFLGLGPALDSALKGHYFPGASNSFWKLLFRSGIWPEEITSDQDDALAAQGFGLADVTSRTTQGTVTATKAEFFNARERVRKLVDAHKPRLVVFVGLKAYRTYLRKPTAPVDYGVQVQNIGGARVFVLPSTSGASMAITSYAEKLEWFKRLAAEVSAARAPQ